MIYYMFYLKKTHSLYAFTNNKKISKQFKKNRNMKKFIFVKNDLNKDVEKEFLEIHLNKDIIIFEGKTLGKLYTLNEFEIPITKKEHLILLQNRALYCNEELYKSAWTNPLIFKNKYFKLLIDIGYADLANDIFSQEIFPDNWNKSVELIPDDYQMLLLIDRNIFI